jgi:rod shape-determining protein MreB
VLVTVAQIYVRLTRNRLEARKLSSSPGAVASASGPFSTERLLIGQFSVASELLSKLLTELVPVKMLRASIATLMHPIEMMDGGLSEVEERTILELAASAGAKRCKIYLGAQIDDLEIARMLDNA